MSLTSEEITAKNFKKFYNEILPYLGSYDKGKLTFVGEVKAFFAETAPNGFLVCDGATYNKADYPQLANLLLSLTDHSAYEVSGDDTKFKVPDLRGEFLRGSGTNSHTNQGSGAGVGVHQDGTIHYSTGTNEASSPSATLAINTPSMTTQKVDNGSLSAYMAAVSASKSSGTDDRGFTYTSRPTNTSVLFCIAYKDTMVDLDFLSYGGERFAKSDMYDTNERVIGKWIDGKPLYQKTVDWGAGPNAADVEREHGIANIDKIVRYWGIANPITSSSSIYSQIIPFVHDQQIGAQVALSVNQTKINIFNRGMNQSIRYFYVIIQYTKTTDTADSFKYSTPTDYSTEEKIVGTWIDGKPLWQKTIDCGAGPNKEIKDVFLNMPNIDKVTYFYSLFCSSGYITISPIVHDSNIQNQLQVDFYYNNDGNKFSIVSRGADRSNTNVYITFQYTKTTDA